MTFGHSTYRCGNYSREETIQGRKLFEEIRYVNRARSTISVIGAKLFIVGIVEWGFYKYPWILMSVWKMLLQKGFQLIVSWLVGWNWPQISIMKWLHCRLYVFTMRALMWNWFIAQHWTYETKKNIFWSESFAWSSQSCCFPLHLLK